MWKGCAQVPAGVMPPPPCTMSGSSTPAVRNARTPRSPDDCAGFGSRNGFARAPLISRRRGVPAMSTRVGTAIAVVLVLLIVAGAAVYAFSGDKARLSETASFGPNPPLPPPVKDLIPTIQIAPATGWPQGG